MDKTMDDKEAKKAALKKMMGAVSKMGMAKVKPLLTITIGAPVDGKPEEESPEEDKEEVVEE